MHFQNVVYITVAILPRPHPIKALTALKYMDRICKKCKKSRVPFQYAIRRVIVRSHEVFKPRDMRLEICDRSKI